MKATNFWANWSWLEVSCTVGGSCTKTVDINNKAVGTVSQPNTWQSCLGYKLWFNKTYLHISVVQGPAMCWTLLQHIAGSCTKTVDINNKAVGTVSQPNTWQPCLGYKLWFNKTYLHISVVQEPAMCWTLLQHIAGSCTKTVDINDKAVGTVSQPNTWVQS